MCGFKTFLHESDNISFFDELFKAGVWKDSAPHGHISGSMSFMYDVAEHEIQVFNHIDIGGRN